jgi:MFS family permease
MWQFSNWRLLPHILMTLFALAPAHTMGSYAPTLVTSFGFDRLKSNAMISIGSWVLIVTNLAWGFIAEKTGRRGLMVLLGILILWGLTVRSPFGDLFARELNVVEQIS